MPSREQCKKILFNLVIEFGVSPRLISERLLNDLDKDDMLEGLIKIEALRPSVELWRDSGMPNVSHGKLLPFKPELKKPKCRYQKPFVCDIWQKDCICRLNKSRIKKSKF